MQRNTIGKRIYSSSCNNKQQTEQQRKKRKAPCGRLRKTRRTLGDPNTYRIMCTLAGESHRHETSCRRGRLENCTYHATPPHAVNAGHYRPSISHGILPRRNEESIHPSILRNTSIVSQKNAGSATPFRVHFDVIHSKGVELGKIRTSHAQSQTREDTQGNLQYYLQGSRCCYNTIHLNQSIIIIIVILSVTMKIAIATSLVVSAAAFSQVRIAVEKERGKERERKGTRKQLSE